MLGGSAGLSQRIPDAICTLVIESNAMSKITISTAGSKGVKKKALKPRSDFPLYPYASGKWAPKPSTITVSITVGSCR